MATGDREEYFPAIEAKHGHPVEHWFDQLGMLESTAYPNQMSLLIDGHGFSRTHANAVVMFYRGSSSSKRFATPADYFQSLKPQHRLLTEAIFDAIDSCHPSLERVMAWNQPMLRHGSEYVFGLSASAKHLSINPFSAEVLRQMSSELKGYEVLKHTVRIPLDWSVDQPLLCDMVSRRIKEVTG